MRGTYGGNSCAAVDLNLLWVDLVSSIVLAGFRNNNFDSFYFKLLGLCNPEVFNLVG